MTEKIEESTIEQHLLDFESQVKTGLLEGKRYVELIDTITNSNDYEDLLSACTEIMTLHPNNSYVNFPHLHSAADFYLIFINKFLSVHQNKSLALTMDPETWEVTGQLIELPAEMQFKFQIEKSENGGAFFVEEETNEKLFYLNLERRMVRINNAALINLFVIKLADQFDQHQVNHAANPIIELFHYLKQDLGFSTDFGILDTDNEKKYYLENPSLPLVVIDKLFVKTNETSYMLMNVSHGLGATLQLADNVQVTLTTGDQQGDTTTNWYFTVNDNREAISFFDVLMSYEFIRSWYLDNRQALEVKSDPLIFAS